MRVSDLGTIVVESVEPREMVDITSKVKGLIPGNNGGSQGFLLLSAEAVSRVMIADTGTRYNASNGILSLLALNTHLTLHMADGRLELGEGQSVFYVELSGPRRAEVSVYGHFSEGL